MLAAHGDARVLPGVVLRVANGEGHLGALREARSRRSGTPIGEVSHGCKSPENTVTLARCHEYRRMLKDLVHIFFVSSLLTPASKLPASHSNRNRSPKPFDTHIIYQIHLLTAQNPSSVSTDHQYVSTDNQPCVISGWRRSACLSHESSKAALCQPLPAPFLPNSSSPPVRPLRPFPPAPF